MHFSSCAWLLLCLLLNSKAWRCASLQLKWFCSCGSWPLPMVWASTDLSMFIFSQSIMNVQWYWLLLLLVQSAAVARAEGKLPPHLLFPHPKPKHSNHPYAWAEEEGTWTHGKWWPITFLLIAFEQMHISTSYKLWTWSTYSVKLFLHHWKISICELADIFSK